MTKTFVDWNPVLPPFFIELGVGALAVLSVWAAWRTRRTWPLWANGCAIGVRAVALASLALLLLRPETVRRQARERIPPLLVVVDDTQSLNLRDDPKGPTRAEQGREALDALLDGVSKHAWEVQAHDAGLQLERRAPGDRAFRARAPATPLGELLAELAGRWAGAGEEPPGAVVLFSDGGVNRGRPLLDAAAALGRKGIPLFAVMLGREHPLPPDAALSPLTVRRDAPAGESPELGGSGANGVAPRLGERLVLEARARLRPGGPGLSGPLADTLVRLKVLGPLGQAPLGKGRGKAKGYLAAAEPLRHRLPQAPAWTAVRMRFTPPAPGDYRLRLSLDRLPGERRLSNNIAYATLRVRPPRQRALYVASRLGHDYRRLKALFAQWDGPPVEIVADFVRPAASESGKIEWPVEAALRRWLDESAAAPGQTGVLIWMEPEPRHLSERMQARLRASIQAGQMGVVWGINEPAAALAERLRASPLADTFLFKSLAAPPEGVGLALKPRSVRATQQARRHLATRWAFSTTPRKGEQAFQALGPTLAWGEFAQPREDTTVLLKAGPRPLLSVGRVGKGRVALLACGESWRWLMPSEDEPGRSEVPALAAELWRRLVDWSAGAAGREEPPVRLFLSKERWALGEELRARVALRGYFPAKGLRVETALARLAPDGTPPPLHWTFFGGTAAPPKNEPDLGEGAAAGRRIFSGRAGRLDARGEWLLCARALKADGALLGSDRARLVAEGSPLEAQSRRPDRAALEAAVQAAGKGSRLLAPSAQGMKTILRELAEVHLRPKITWRVERAPVIHRGMLCFLLILALVVDAWLRRG